MTTSASHLAVPRHEVVVAFVAASEAAIAAAFADWVPCREGGAPYEGATPGDFVVRRVGVGLQLVPRDPRVVAMVEHRGALLRLDMVRELLVVLEVVTPGTVGQTMDATFDPRWVRRNDEGESSLREIPRQSARRLALLTPDERKVTAERWASCGSTMDHLGASMPRVMAALLDPLCELAQSALATSGGSGRLWLHCDGFVESPLSARPS